PQIAFAKFQLIRLGFRADCRSTTDPKSRGLQETSGAGGHAGKRRRLQEREEAMSGKIKLVSVALALALSVPAMAADMPGVTPTEIKIGGIFPFSGPASSIGLVGRGILAYVQSVNDRGGINGRKINYIAYDDAYSPPKAVEHARKLVESDEIAFMFSQLGTPGNTAVAKYLISRGVPT